MQPHPDFEGNVLCFGILSPSLSLSLSLSTAAQSGVSSDYDDDDDDDGDDYRRTVVVHQRL